MQPLSTIHLTNWRCFSNSVFNLPKESFLILDQNGSGKTSLLLAIYSLLTGLPWPNTKLKDSLSFTKDYFGISTSDKEWFVSGQLGRTGRMSVKYENLTEIKLPQVITYIPDDNLWLFQSRSKKLDTLDTLLSQVYGVEYTQALTKLTKNVQNKQSIIKRFLDSGVEPDLLLVKNLNQNIFQLSSTIWQQRKAFLTQLESSLSEYLGWIESSALQIVIDWKVSQFNGFKGKWLEQELTQTQQQELFKKELIVGRVLYGAQRDELDFFANNSPLQTVLSRGEMRAFIMFIKHFARTQIKGEVLWMLDDIFNEFDDVREDVVLRTVSAKGDQFIATGTRKVKLGKKDKVLSLKELVNSN
jgi:DNA replication and repair protein RecF